MAAAGDSVAREAAAAEAGAAARGEADGNARAAACWVK
jgi:hypothetical protein